MGNQGGSSSGVTKIKDWVDKKLIGKSVRFTLGLIDQYGLKDFKCSNKRGKTRKSKLGFMAGLRSIEDTDLNFIHSIERLVGLWNWSFRRYGLSYFRCAL